MDMGGLAGGRSELLQRSIQLIQNNSQVCSYIRNKIPVALRSEETNFRGLAVLIEMHEFCRLQSTVSSYISKWHLMEYFLL